MAANGTQEDDHRNEHRPAEPCRVIRVRAQTGRIPADMDGDIHICSCIDVKVCIYTYSSKISINISIIHICTLDASVCTHTYLPPPGFCISPHVVNLSLLLMASILDEYEATVRAMATRQSRKDTMKRYEYGWMGDRRSHINRITCSEKSV